MKAIICTHDMTQQNRHLMPWRMVCEIVRHVAPQHDGATLTSLCNRPSRGASAELVADEIIPNDSTVVSKNRNELADDLEKCLAKTSDPVLFWPLSAREPNWRLELLRQLDTPLVGYFPGGIYRRRSVLYAARRIGIRKTLPYLREVFTNHRAALDRFRQAGFRDMIAMSTGSAQSLVDLGWPTANVHPIPPGRDPSAAWPVNGQLPNDFERFVRGRPYFVFMGPPSRIRGIDELCHAFDMAAESCPDICLVCLMRADGTLDSQRIRKTIDGMRHKDRVYAVWESVVRADLAACISHCHAVVLPFVLVPSEIPLAVIEVMAFAKPVITTAGNGTGSFVDGFGVTTELGNTEALSSSLCRLASDKSFHEQKCGQAKTCFDQHPSWSDVSDAWMRVGKRAISK